MFRIHFAEPPYKKLETISKEDIKIMYATIRYWVRCCQSQHGHVSILHDCTWTPWRPCPQCGLAVLGEEEKRYNCEKTCDLLALMLAVFENYKIIIDKDKNETRKLRRTSTKRK
jgi:endogenous inhibitor of DNA gyrase (YacG/DUF329 family)